MYLIILRNKKAKRKAAKAEESQSRDITADLLWPMDADYWAFQAQTGIFEQLKANGKAETPPNQRVSILRSHKSFRDQQAIVSKLWQDAYPTSLPKDQPELVVLRNLAVELSLTRAKKAEIRKKVQSLTDRERRRQQQAWDW